MENKRRKKQQRVVRNNNEPPQPTAANRKTFSLSVSENGQGDWFVCLFSPVEWISFGQNSPSKLNEAEDQRVKKKSSKKKKTFVLVTMNPKGTLLGLRNGVIPLPGMRRSVSSLNIDSEITSNMELGCMVGPVESKERALAFRKLWEETSRGLVSRSMTGRVLATEYKYRSSINWNAFYRLHSNDVYIEETTDECGEVVDLLITIIRTI